MLIGLVVNPISTNNNILMSRRVHKINKVLCRKFGQKVRKLRMEKGLSQEVLAFDSKISRSYISCIERGETDITLSTALNIAKALNINLTELLEFTIPLQINNR